MYNDGHFRCFHSSFSRSLGFRFSKRVANRLGSSLSLCYHPVELKPSISPRHQRPNLTYTIQPRAPSKSGLNEDPQLMLQLVSGSFSKSIVGQGDNDTTTISQPAVWQY